MNLFSKLGGCSKQKTESDLLLLPLEIRRRILGFVLGEHCNITVRGTVWRYSHQLMGVCRQLLEESFTVHPNGTPIKLKFALCDHQSTSPPRKMDRMAKIIQRKFRAYKSVYKSLQPSREVSSLHIVTLQRASSITIEATAGTCKSCVANIFKDLRLIPPTGTTITLDCWGAWSPFINTTWLLRAFHHLSEERGNCMSRREHVWFQAIFCKRCQRPRYAPRRDFDCVMCLCGAGACKDCLSDFVGKYGQTCIGPPADSRVFELYGVDGY